MAATESANKLADQLVELVQTGNTSLTLTNSTDGQTIPITGITIIPAEAPPPPAPPVIPPEFANITGQSNLDVYASVLHMESFKQTFWLTP